MSNTYEDVTLRNKGGPAYPVSIPGCGDNGWHGMTLRDYFAAQVMGHMISLSTDSDGGWSPDNVARGCYNLADAMLRARAQTDN